MGHESWDRVRDGVVGEVKVTETGQIGEMGEVVKGGVEGVIRDIKVFQERGLEGGQGAGEVAAGETERDEVGKAGEGANRSRELRIYREVEVLEVEQAGEGGGNRSALEVEIHKGKTVEVKKVVAQAIRESNIEEFSAKWTNGPSVFSATKAQESNRPLRERWERSETLQRGSRKCMTLNPAPDWMLWQRPDPRAEDKAE